MVGVEETGGNGEIAAGAGGGSGGRGGGGGSAKGREEWAPLWEAMGVLSVPSVTVGATAAGKGDLVF